MNNKEEILSEISDKITTNGLQKIKGDDLNTILTSMVKIIPNDASFSGILKPSSNIIPDGVSKWFWAEPGTYTFVDNLVIERLGIISYEENKWSGLEVDLPKVKQHIPLFENLNFPVENTSNEKVITIYEDSIFQLSDGNLATSVDLPYNSNMWFELGNKKSVKFIGKNKVNPNYIVRGFYYDTPGHEFTPNPDWRITEAIPVTGNMISNKSLAGSGITNIVLDENRNYLRKFNTPHYSYQSGDCFVVWSYRGDWEDFQVEEGDISTTFEGYTDKEDVMSFVRPQEMEIDIYAAELITPVDNGGIIRRLGFDIPSGQVGNNSYIQVKPFATALQGRYKVTVICNHINHSSFLVWEGHTNTSLGAGVTMFESTFENEILNVIIFPINLTAGSDRYFRISQIFILPLDAESRDNLAKVIVNPEYVKRIDISSGFDATTQGWGDTRFANLVTAWEADDVDYLQGRRNRKTLFTSMPGIDNYWETRWPGNDAEDPTDGTYQGIVPRNHQYFDTFDLDDVLTEWVWNGHAGYSTGFVMSTTQAMKKSPFHIIDAGVKSRIRGAKITCANTRYCIHPESAGTGNKAEWLLENLILNWGGRPNTISPGGTHLGIGISSGETGHVKNVKFIGIAGGVGGHNNGWGTNQGAKPFICPSAKLTIENCDFNGNDINMHTYSNDADVPDSLIIKDCGKINILSLGFTPPATVQNWKVHVINSYIDDNQI